MSENMQNKPGELVPTASLGPVTETDKMFAGLGLGSYVTKRDTGAIATGLMSNSSSSQVFKNSSKLYYLANLTHFCI